MNLLPVTTEAVRQRFVALASPSALTAQDLARHQPDASWILLDADDICLGRYSLWWSQCPPYPGHKLGFIGHYAANNSAAAGVLLPAACMELAAQDCTMAVGPLDGTTWQRYRLLTERGSEPLFFLEPDNPDDWPGHFACNGFMPLATYYSALNPHLDVADPRIPELAQRAAALGVQLRCLDPMRFHEELRAIHALSLASFPGNFLYSPIAEEDFVAQYQGIEPYVRPEMILLAERAGRLLGFVFAIPDLNQARRGEPIDTVILKTMAVHPEARSLGLGGLLIARCHEAAHRLGFRRAIHALMHENNHSRRISSHTAQTIRRYALFAKELSLSGRRGTVNGARGGTLNLCEILSIHTRVRPQAPAIIDTHRGSDRFTSFAQLEDAAARAAGLFRQHGLRPGDAVLVLQPMSAELYAVLLGLFRIRLIAMFLDPSAGREHVEQCLALHRPRAFVGSARAHLLRLWSPELRRVPLKFAIGFPVPGAISWSRAARTSQRDILACEPDTPALLTFTSGSTGKPKAAVRTHGFLLAQHRILEHSLELNAGDVDLTTLPIVLLANLGSGVTSVIPNADLRYPGAIRSGPVVAQIEKHGVVSSTASPAFFECLIGHCSASGTILMGLKKLFSGGAPVFPRLLDQLLQLAPEADVVAVYGSTEAEPIAHIRRRELRPKDVQAMNSGRGLLTGSPVEALHLRIMRDQWGQPIGPYSTTEFGDLWEPVGEPGEIVVSGAHVLSGYLHGLGDEETKFRVDGAIWHRTGDAGYLDAQGRLWLLGRCAARIADDRGVLYPFAAETALYQIPAVRRAALVAHAGRRILAVEFQSSPSEGDMRQIHAALAWTTVDEVRICKRIPVDKRHNAKIDYPSLHRLLESTSCAALKEPRTK